MPGAARQALRVASRKLRVAQSAVRDVPAKYRGTRWAAGEGRILKRMAARFDVIAGEIPVKRSGGARAAGEQMLHAALAAYDLFVERGRTPTLTRDGDYFQLTGILYELATGRTRDPERACRRFINQIVRQDFARGTDAFETLTDPDLLPPDHPRRRTTARK